MTAPNRAPSSVWCLSRDNLGVYVRAAADDKVVVVVGEYEYEQQWVSLSRRDARLLAKRINQCLDATAKR